MECKENKSWRGAEIKERSLLYQCLLNSSRFTSLLCLHLPVFSFHILHLIIIYFDSTFTHLTRSLSLFLQPWRGSHCNAVCPNFSQFTFSAQQPSKSDKCTSIKQVSSQWPWHAHKDPHRPVSHHQQQHQSHCNPLRCTTRHKPIGKCCTWPSRRPSTFRTRLCPNPPPLALSLSLSLWLPLSFPLSLYPSFIPPPSL